MVQWSPHNLRGPSLNLGVIFELRNCLSLWHHLGSNSGPTGSWPPAFMAPPFKASTIRNIHKTYQKKRCMGKVHKEALRSIKTKTASWNSIHNYPSTVKPLQCICWGGEWVKASNVLTTATCVGTPWLSYPKAEDYIHKDKWLRKSNPDGWGTVEKKDSGS